MTKAERELVKYLLTICGGDNCRKCVHCDKPTCCQYVSPTDYSGELNDDYCIDGMTKYFEQGANYGMGKKSRRLVDSKR